jgi:hypothetical protein
MPLSKVRVKNHSQQGYLDRHGKIRQEPALKAALVANAWALDDTARALSMRRTPNYTAIVQALPFEVTTGVVVGLRPAGTKLSAPWRESVENAGLSPVDRAVDGNESAARRLTQHAIAAHAGAYATTAGIDVVVIAGIVDLVDTIAGICRAYGRLLAVADHRRTGLHDLGAADVIIELGSQCFPQPTTNSGNARCVEVAL